MFKLIIKILAIIIFLFQQEIKAQIVLNKDNLASLCNCNPSESNLIKLSALKITKIEPNTFNGLDSLETLILSENLLTDIDPITFNGLNSLETLYLSDNKINKIEQDSFKGLNSLVTLSLEVNNIVSLNKNAFLGLINLQKVCMAKNPIINSLPASGLILFMSTICNGNPKCKVEVFTLCRFIVK
jgi:Leucine-rich repeat (LRR) protein